MPLYRYDQTGSRLVDIPLASTGSTGGGTGGGTTSTTWDWSATNLPQLADTTSLTTRLPAGANVDPLLTGSSDFWTNLRDTVSAANSRVVVDLTSASLPRIQHLNQFRLIGSSGSPSYAFGFWFSNLAGFIGNGFNSDGTGRTVIQMDANSMTQAQLDALSAMTSASFAPNQMGLCRIDGSASSPIFLSGVTFRAADQNPLTTVYSDVPAQVPQSAPHQGVVIYASSSYVIDRCAFIGAGKAMTSSPPFEHGNLSVSKSTGSIYHTEFDGRRSVELDATRTRACCPVMFNNEKLQELYDCWLHHSNVSRYAANDQNALTAALSTTYRAVRTKVEQINTTQNDGRGGSSNATPMGWESSNALIDLVDPIISQDDPFTSPQIAQHLQLTAVGGVNPQGGRFRVTRGTFRNTVIPVLDGWCQFRIPTGQFWYTDGLANTITVTNTDGSTKQPWIYTGTWTNAAISAAITAAGVNKNTHYLVRTS